MVADDDGVMCVPLADVPAVVAASAAREATEAGKRAQFAAGTLGLDLYDLRPTLERLGVVYLDEDDA
ncbi:hypothetical protein ACFQX8_07785 [Klenkia terrae]|uniref:hypothetical protein n=1 Tax=Klenkia terrae TaxID=1052259 RepID=UPI00361378D8